MSIVTGTSNYTIYIEDGEEVFPCRCGETHRGPYAFYDFMHHNCDHPSPLLLIALDQALCGECGYSWEVQDLREQTGLP